MRFLKKYCHAHMGRERKGQKCPECRRFTCTPCMAEMKEVFGDTVKCIYCGTVIWQKPKPKPIVFKAPKIKGKSRWKRPSWSKGVSHKIDYILGIDPAKPDAKPIVVKKRAISFKHFDELETFDSNRSQVRSRYRKLILEHCLKHPSTVTGVYTSVRWPKDALGNIRYPAHGRVWMILLDLVKDGKLRKAMYSDLPYYGPPNNVVGSDTTVDYTVMVSK